MDSGWYPTLEQSVAAEMSYDLTGFFMSSPRLSWLWNAAMALGLALMMSACGGDGPHTTPPPNSPFEMLYTPTASQVGMLHVNPSTGALGTPTTTPLRQSTGAISTVSFTIFISANIDPQGKFIFMSGAQGDAIAGFALNSSTGAATLADATSSLPFSPGPMAIISLP